MRQLLLRLPPPLLLALTRVCPCAAAMSIHLAPLLTDCSSVSFGSSTFPAWISFCERTGTPVCCSICSMAFKIVEDGSISSCSTAFPCLTDTQIKGMLVRNSQTSGGKSGRANQGFGTAMEGGFRDALLRDGKGTT